MWCDGGAGGMMEGAGGVMEGVGGMMEGAGQCPMVSTT